MLIEFHTDPLGNNPNNFTTNGYVFFNLGERKIHYNLLTNMKVAIGLNKDTIIAYILNEIYKVTPLLVCSTGNEKGFRGNSLNSTDLE